MKKIISLLLVIMIVLSISACGGNETTIDNDTGSSTTQNQTDVTDTSSTEQSRDTPSSTTDNSGASDSTDVPDSTTSKPTTTTKPETSKPSTTTKPSTPTHTHSYSDATCTEPAKCSCGATKGSAKGHIYINDFCAVCNRENPDPWQYKNGGDDHIIKYNNSTSNKIGIDTKHIDVPADDPNGYYIIVCEIKRDHIAQVGDWVYFDEKINYHNEYIKETESGNYGGIFGNIYNLCRIKSNGTMFEELCVVSSKSQKGLAYVLGFDGSNMYFLKSYDYEPGGQICSIDLSKEFKNIIDDATVYNQFILFPLESNINNGIIYITEDDGEGGKNTIVISSLK